MILAPPSTSAGGMEKIGWSDCKSPFVLAATSSIPCRLYRGRWIRVAKVQNECISSTFFSIRPFLLIKFAKRSMYWFNSHLFQNHSVETYWADFCKAVSTEPKGDIGKQLKNNPPFILWCKVNVGSGWLSMYQISFALFQNEWTNTLLVLCQKIGMPYGQQKSKNRWNVMTLLTGQMYFWTTICEKVMHKVKNTLQPDAMYRFWMCWMISKHTLWRNCYRRKNHT